MKAWQEEVQLSQGRETPVQTASRGHIIYRYAYARSAETRAAQQPGQDYIVVRLNDQTFVFALCDGVGESFYGDLAARFLGNRLLDWLWNEADPEYNRESLCALLNTKLHEWTAPASELVHRQALPSDMPSLQREALEEKRMLGSQTTFVCGRIDLVHENLPQWRALFAWLGDSRIRIWNTEGECTQELGGTFDPAQRWSSSRGTIGRDPHLFLVPSRAGSPALIAFMVYSDGLAMLDQLAQSPSNHALQELIDRSAESAASDDASFLEVWLAQTPPWAEVKAVAVPPKLQVALAGRQMHVAWQPVADAIHYEVQLDGQPNTWQVAAPEWLSPVLAPGNYRVRVRTWHEQQAGAWSQWQSLAIPELMPTPVQARPSAAHMARAKPASATTPSAQHARNKVLMVCIIMALLLLLVTMIVCILTATGVLGEWIQMQRPTPLILPSTPRPELKPQNPTPGAAGDEDAKFIPHLLRSLLRIMGRARID